MYFGSKKIADYEIEDFKRLFKFILDLCKFLGITEAPDKDTVEFLLGYLIEHHKDFSKEEIQSAFSLATSGDLGIEFNHYNRMTPQLISLVLNKYKHIRSSESIRLEKELEKKRIEEDTEKNKPTIEERLKLVKESCIRMFDSYKEQKSNGNIKGRVEVRDWGSVCYDFLAKIGCIKFTNEKKKEIKEIAKTLLISEKAIESREFRKKKIVSIINEVVGGDSTALIVKSKQVALETYFDILIEMDMNIIDEIENVGDEGEENQI